MHPDTTHWVYELWHLWIWWGQILLAEWQRLLYLSQPAPASTEDTP